MKRSSLMPSSTGHTKYLCEFNRKEKPCQRLYNHLIFNWFHCIVTSIQSMPLFINIYYLTLIFMCTTLVQSVSTSTKIFSSDQLGYATFRTSNASINFTHIALDPNSGRVYIGATNWLHQLDSNLSVESSLRTGPVEDSASCSPTDCTGVDESLVKLTKNVNKVLVVDPVSRMLISCGSVHQGSCRRHSLSDVKLAEPLVGIPVAANDENSTTFAFVGPARYFGNNKLTNVLHVGASNSRLGPYRDMVPAISSRSLEPGQRLFSIIEKSFTDTARVDISYHLRDYFVVKYMAGFHSNGFIYFATVQKKSHFRDLEEWGYLSRLARVCSSDAGYHTYTEVTLTCTGPGGVEYSLIQDASVTRAGSNLASYLKIEEGSEVLAVVFAASKDHSSIASAPSAMCLFPMDEVERTFSENIHLCYNGSVVTRNMDYIAGNVQDCPEPGKSGNIMSFCSETLKLNGAIPITGTAVISYPDLVLTSVLPVTVGRHTFAYVGTADGHLKKINLRKSSCEEVDDITLDPGQPILPDMFLDRSERHVYAASAYKIIKVAIDRCDSYDSCRLHHQEQLEQLHHNQQQQHQQFHRSHQKHHQDTLIPATVTSSSLSYSPSLPSSSSHFFSPASSSSSSSVSSSASISSGPSSSSSSSSSSASSSSSGSTAVSAVSMSLNEPIIYNLDPLESFASGGRKITVFGTGFQAASTLTSGQQQQQQQHQQQQQQQQREQLIARMIAYNALGPVNDSICTVINDSVMHCPSPCVKKEWQAKSAELGAELDELRLGISVSFSPASVLSSSSSLRSSSSSYHHSYNSGNNNNFPLPPEQRMSPLSSASSLHFHSNHHSSSGSFFAPPGPIKWTIKYLPDPVVFFQAGSDEGVKLYTRDPLVIEGDNLNLAATVDEISVSVGLAVCNVTSFTLKQLICQPPPHLFTTGNIDEDDSTFSSSSSSPSLPPVIVHIGSNLHFKVGYLRYDMHDSADDISHLLYLTSAAVVGALIVVILVAITTLRRKSSGRHSRQPSAYLFSTADALHRGSHHQYDLSDTSKLPVPLITSSVVKPLPLIPSKGGGGGGGGSTGTRGTSDLSTPTDSAVNAIYSEISELNITSHTCSTSTTTGSNSNNDQHTLSTGANATGHNVSFTSRLNQLSGDNNCVTRVHQSSVTGTPYPPFYTFNTIGRSKNRSNPYIFHDSMAPVIRPSLQVSLDSNNLVNGSSLSPLVPPTSSCTSSSSSSNSTSSSSPASSTPGPTVSSLPPSSNTYAVYAFNKFNRANTTTGSASVVIGRPSKLHTGSPGSKDRFV